MHGQIYAWKNTLKQLLRPHFGILQIRKCLLSPHTPAMNPSLESIVLGKFQLCQDSREREAISGLWSPRSNQLYVVRIMKGQWLISFGIANTALPTCPKVCLYDHTPGLPELWENMDRKISTQQQWSILQVLRVTPKESCYSGERAAHNCTLLVS